MKTAGIRDLQEVVSDFTSFLDNRSDWFLFYNPAVMDRILDWQKVSWVNWFTFMDSDSGDWSEWATIYQSLSNAITLIGKRCITAGQYSYTETFSKRIRKHLLDNQDLKVEGKKTKWFYRDYAYQSYFARILDFLSAKTSEEDYFWDNFPSDWKITESNLASGKVFSRLSYGQFLNTALSRISSNRQEFDMTLHTLVENLFPEVETATWEYILIFSFSSYSSEARVKSVIERYWVLGYPSMKSVPFVTGFGDVSEEDIAKQLMQRKAEIEQETEIATKKTYELALKLFGNIFTKESLSSFIKEAENLKYDPNMEEERKRKKLLTVFKGLESSLK